MTSNNLFQEHKTDNVSGLTPDELTKRYPNHTLRDLMTEYQTKKFLSRQSGLGYLWVKIGDITLHVYGKCVVCGHQTIRLPYHLRWLYAVLANYDILAREGSLCYLCDEKTNGETKQIVLA